MAEIKDLSTTDANNNGSAANAGFAENMNYSAVNDAARALEGMIARWYKDGNGTLTTGGSSNAYTLTPNRTISAYADGDCFLIEANHTNTGAATLNVSALGAKSIVTPDGSALNANAIVSGGRYIVTYDGTNFQIIGAGGAALLSANNTFSGTATFSSTATFNDAATFNGAFGIYASNNGDTAAPNINLVRVSSSPTVNDDLARIIWYGYDSAANLQTYAYMDASIQDPTSTSEDGILNFYTTRAGVGGGRVSIGSGLYMAGATGGDKGGGTINATAVYDDNTLLTDYVMDAAVTGSINLSAYDNTVPNRERPGRPVEVRTHEPARRFVQRLDDLDPKAYGQKWKTSRRLPAFDHRAGEQLSVGEYAQRLLETCEVQAVHIDKLLERIEALEARLNNGRPN